ncbi:MAG: hypothetical protein JWO77_2869 [Ilumatobacteraceae bacterium]|nr:hypothetical protein [Ilumatobacteraceae bacterium]
MTEGSGGVGPLAEGEFIQRLGARLAIPTTVLSRATRFDALPQDRASRAFLLRALTDLLPGAPPDLVLSVETVGEAHEWHVQRLQAVRTGRVVGDAAGAEDAPRVLLRPIDPSDHWPLYQAAIRPESAFRWRYRGATPSFERFIAGLHDGVLVQHVVQAVDGPPVGLVVCYQASMESRTAFFGFIRTTETSQDGMMFEGLMLFLRFLFDTWDFRKLYAEVPAYNFDGILSEQTRGIEVEGILRGHLFHAGTWWDQYLIALWRERWMAESASWFGTESPAPA